MGQTVVRAIAVHINQGTPTTNYGVTNPCVVRLTNAIVCLWVANLTLPASGDEIPVGATITRVRFVRNIVTAGSNPATHTSSRVLRTFTEGTGNGTITSNGADWNTYNGSSAWTTVGALGEGTDIIAADGWNHTRQTGSGTETLDSNTIPALLTFIQTTIASYSSVARWREHASAGIVGQTYSSDEDATLYPYLVIDWTPATTPSTSAPPRSRFRSRLSRFRFLFTRHN